MASSNPPLDEIVSARPEINDWWVHDQGGQPMDENLIHRYFYETPYFDHSSKNGLLLGQAATNLHTWQLSCNRKAFEEDLRKRAGLEYMIVGEPEPVADKELAAEGAKTGIWVIRKQWREHARDNAVRPPGVHVEGPWEITVLGTYYIVGMNVYQAPNVFDIVGNRLLSAASSVNKMMDIMQDLPRYSPTAGYSYLPPSQTSRAATAASTTGTPVRSREGSVAPGAESQSQRSGSAQPAAQLTTSDTAANYEENRLLASSLQMAIQYSDWYTDENPLLGEPNNFKYTSSHAAIKKRRADEEAASAKARAEKESAPLSQAASPKTATPQAVAAFTTEVKQPGKDGKTKEERRASKSGDKIKRRKSKAHTGFGPSPTTPSGATAIRTPTSAQ